jgi:hypothetical protein
VIGYDFGEKKVLEESARSQLRTLIMDKYKPSPALLQSNQWDPIDWYCNLKTALWANSSVRNCE